MLFERKRERHPDACQCNRAGGVSTVSRINKPVIDTPATGGSSRRPGTIAASTLFKLSAGAPQHE